MATSVRRPVESVTLDDDVEVLPTEIINLSIDSSDDEEADKVSVISIATTAGETCTGNLDQTKANNSSGEVKDADEFWESIKTEDEDVNSYVVPYLQSFAPIKVNNTNNIEIINDEETAEEQVEINDVPPEIVPSLTSGKGNMSTLHVCPECNFEAAERSKYLQHLKDLHRVVLHECPYCPSKYLHEEFLLSHVRQIHFQLSKLKCCTCQGSYDNYTQLRSHLSTSHDCSRAQLVENIDFEYVQDNIQEPLQSGDESGKKAGAEYQTHKRHIRSVPAKSLVKLRKISTSASVVKHADAPKTVSIKDKNTCEDVADSKKFNNMLNHMFLLEKFSDFEKRYERILNVGDNSENSGGLSGSMFINTRQVKEVCAGATLPIHEHEAVNVMKSTQANRHESSLTSASVQRWKSGYVTVIPIGNVKIRVEPRLKEAINEVKSKCTKAKHLDDMMKSVQPDPKKTSVGPDAEIVQKMKTACLESPSSTTTDCAVVDKGKTECLKAELTGNLKETRQLILDRTSAESTTFEESKPGCANVNAFSNLKTTTRPSSESSFRSVSAIVETFRSRCGKTKRAASAKEATQSNTEKTSAGSPLVDTSKPECVKANLIGGVKENTLPNLEESLKSDSALVAKTKSRRRTKRADEVQETTLPSLITSTGSKIVALIEKTKSEHAKVHPIDNVKKHTRPCLEGVTSNSAGVEKIRSGRGKTKQVANGKEIALLNLEKVNTGSALDELEEKSKPGCAKANPVSNLKRTDAPSSLESTFRVENIKSGCGKTKPCRNEKQTTHPNLEEIRTAGRLVVLVEKGKPGCEKANRVGNVKKDILPSLEETLKSASAAIAEMKFECENAKQVGSAKRAGQPNLEKTTAGSSLVALAEKAKPRCAKANPINNAKKHIQPHLEESLESASAAVEEIKSCCGKTKCIANVKEATQPNLEKISTGSGAVALVEKSKPRCTKANPIGNIKETTQPSLRESSQSVGKMKSRCKKTENRKQVTNVKETTRPDLEKTSSGTALVTLEQKSRPKCTKASPNDEVKKNTRPSSEESLKSNSAVVGKAKFGCEKTTVENAKESKHPNLARAITDSESVTFVAKRKSEDVKTIQVDNVEESPSLEETSLTTDDALVEEACAKAIQADNMRESRWLTREEPILTADSTLIEKAISECPKANAAGIVNTVQPKAKEASLTTDNALTTKRKPPRTRVKRHFCYVCGSAFVREHELVTHTRSKHVDYKMLQCVHCESTFGYFWALKRHMRSNHEIIHVSLYKDFKFVEKISNLSSENVKALSEDENHLEADSCQSATKEIETITNKTVERKKDDVQTHPARDEVNSRMFSCGRCKFMTGERDKLKKHMVDTHKSQLLHKCSYCEKSYETTAELTSHLQQFHKYSESLLCLTCNRKFKYMKILKEHVRQRHGNDAALSPDVDFRVIEEMSNSVADVKPRRKFRCVRCGFKSGKNQMRAHVKTHRPINLLKKANHDKVQTGVNVRQGPNDRGYNSLQGKTVDLLRINRKIQRRNSAIRAGTLECEKRTVFIAKPFGNSKDESCRNDSLEVTNQLASGDLTFDLISEIIGVPKTVKGQENVCDLQVGDRTIASGVTRGHSLPVTEMSVSPVKSSEECCKMARSSRVLEEQDMQELINSSQKSRTEKGLKESTLSSCVETSSNRKRKLKGEIKPATIKRLKVESEMHIGSNEPNEKATPMKSPLELDPTEKMENVESLSPTIQYADSINMVNSKILDIENLESKSMTCVDQTANALCYVMATNETENRINKLQDVTLNHNDIERTVDSYSTMQHAAYKVVGSLDSKPENTKGSDFTKIVESSQNDCDENVITIGDSPITINNVNEDSIEIEEDILHGNENSHNKNPVNIDASLEELRYAKENNIVDVNIDRDIKPLSSGGNTKTGNDEFDADYDTFKESVDHTEELNNTSKCPDINSNITSDEILDTEKDDDDIIFVNTYIETERNINNIEFLDENASEQSTMTTCEEYMDVSEDLTVKAGIELEKDNKNIELIANGKSESIVDVADETKCLNKSPCNLICKSEDSLQMEIKNENPLQMEIKKENPIQIEIKKENPIQIEIKNENPNIGKVATPVLQAVDQNDGVQDRSESAVDNVSKISKSKLIRVLSDVSLRTMKSFDGNCLITNCSCEDRHAGHVPKQTLNAENNLPTIGIPNACGDYNGQVDDCGTTKYKVTATESPQVLPNKLPDSLADVTKRRQVKNKTKKANRKRKISEAADVNFSNANVEKQIRKLKYIKISSTHNILENESYVTDSKSTVAMSHQNEVSIAHPQSHSAASQILKPTHPSEDANASSSGLRGGIETDAPSQLETAFTRCETACNDDNVKEEHPAMRKVVPCPPCDLQFATEVEYSFHVRRGHKTKPSVMCELCQFRHPSSRCVMQHRPDRGLWCRYCEMRCADLLTLRNHLTSVHRDRVGQHEKRQGGREGTKARSIMLESDVLLYERVNVSTPPRRTLQRLGTLYRKDGSLHIYEVEEAYAEDGQAQVSSDVGDPKLDASARMSRSKAEVVDVRRSKKQCYEEDLMQGRVEVLSDVLAAGSTVSETPLLKMTSGSTTVHTSVIPDQLNTRVSVGRRKKAPARKLTILRK